MLLTHSIQFRDLLDHRIVYQLHIVRIRIVATVLLQCRELVANASMLGGYTYLMSASRIGSSSCGMPDMLIAAMQCATLAEEGSWSSGLAPAYGFALVPPSRSTWLCTCQEACVSAKSRSVLAGRQLFCHRLHVSCYTDCPTMHDEPHGGHGSSVSVNQGRCSLGTVCHALAHHATGSSYAPHALPTTSTTLPCVRRDWL